MALCVLSACATTPAEPDVLDLRYIARQNDYALDEAPCVWIDDRRRQDVFYGMRVTREAALEWLGDGVSNQLRVRTRVAESIPEKGLLITLRRAYVNPIDTNLSAVVVLKVNWGERESIYRGQELKTNWWSATSEFGKVLSAALDEALLQINFPVTTSTCDLPDAA